jgi:magnesium and cobalt transporter
VIELVLFLIIIISYLTGYLVSLYSLAVYIDPDEVETLFPGLKKDHRKFLERLTDDPRAFRQTARVYKAFLAVLVSFLSYNLVIRLADVVQLDSMVGLVPVLVLVWLLHLLFFEYLPRRSSRTAINERMLRHLWLIRFVFSVFWPVAALYRWGFERPSGDSVSEEDKDEIVERAIEALADDAGIHEAIVEEDEKEMIGQIFQLDQTLVREIMVPRPDITGIERSMTFKQIRDLVLKDGHSRYPVFEGSIDNIVGFMYVKDLFNRMPEPGETFKTDNYLRQPYLVPETKVIGELLGEFKTIHQHIALVADEYGGVAGLVTLEDIIEEIFGEIQDEHDSEQAEITPLEDGVLRVSAGVMVEKLQDFLNTDHEQGDHDTVGGLIYDLVGSVPNEGQTVVWHDLEFEVERTEGQRIMVVKVRRS